MAVTGNSEVMTDISHSVVSEQPDTETFDREMHIPLMNNLYWASICGMHISSTQGLTTKTCLKEYMFGCKHY